MKRFLAVHIPLFPEGHDPQAQLPCQPPRCSINANPNPGACCGSRLGSAGLNKQQSSHAGTRHGAQQKGCAHTAGERFKCFLQVTSKRKMLLKQGRNCPRSVTSLLASTAHGDFDGCGTAESRGAELYSSPPHNPLLPTMNLGLGNRVLLLESQPQTAECFGKLTRASAWAAASSLMQQCSQRLPAKRVEEGRGGGALNLAANFQSARSLGRLCDSCD